jgi:hypothetical protein
LGCEGACSLPHMSGICCAKVIIKVATPLSVELDGDAVVLSRVAGLELGSEVGGSEAHHWHVWCR